MHSVLCAGIPQAQLTALLATITQKYSCEMGSLDVFAVCDCTAGIDDFPSININFAGVRCHPVILSSCQTVILPSCQPLMLLEWLCLLR